MFRYGDAILRARIHYYVRAVCAARKMRAKKRRGRATAAERGKRKRKEKRGKRSSADAARVSARTVFAGAAKRVTIIAA